MGGRGSASRAVGNAAPAVAPAGGGARRNLIGGRRTSRNPIIRNLVGNARGGNATTGGGISGLTGTTVRRTVSTGPIPARNARLARQRRRRSGRGR